MKPLNGQGSRFFLLNLPIISVIINVDFSVAFSMRRSSPCCRFPSIDENPIVAGGGGSKKRHAHTRPITVNTLLRERDTLRLLKQWPAWTLRKPWTALNGAAPLS